MLVTKNHESLKANPISMLKLSRCKHKTLTPVSDDADRDSL
jgi:hypothetical protein